MKDKLSEFRDLMKGGKATSEPGAAPLPDDDTPASQEDFGASDDTVQESPNEWQIKYEEVLQANALQKDMYLRQAAEFENMRKRLRKEFDDNIKFAAEKIVKDLLPVLDNLEMALSHALTESNSPQSLIEGVRMTLKQFAAVLLQNGIEEISGENAPFDPNTQEAIGTDASSDVPSGHVTKVHRKGYSLNGRLIRAAMVTVKG